MKLSWILQKCAWILKKNHEINIIHDPLLLPRVMLLALILCIRWRLISRIVHVKFSPSASLATIFGGPFKGPWCWRGVGGLGPVLRSCAMLSVVVGSFWCCFSYNLSVGCRHICFIVCHGVNIISTGAILTAVVAP